MAHRAGRHLLQLPGPSAAPERILRALSQPVIDHRGPAFRTLAARVLEGLKPVFGTEHRVFITPSSATGAWESALVNTLSPGDRIVVFVRGVFSERWARVASRFGLDVQAVEGDWRRPVLREHVARALEADAERRVRAVAMVHSETSTGVLSDVTAVRAALDAAEHPALLFVDAVSSLAATEYHHDDWGVDVTVCGGQKALMLPPGLAFTAAGPRALKAHASASLPRSYWDWSDAMRANDDHVFPYTPATNLLFGLDEALTMLREEGLENVYARHARHSRATRAAVAAWGLELWAESADDASPSVTAVQAPEGQDANHLRRVVLDHFDVALGGGLGRLDGALFRIGHLGDLNDATLCGALSAVEMGLQVAGWPHRPGGVRAAMDHLASAAGGE